MTTQTSHNMLAIIGIFVCLMLSPASVTQAGDRVVPADGPNVGEAHATIDAIREPLKIGALSLKPLMYLEDRVPKGILVQLQYELLEEAGLEYVLQFMPLARMYNELKLEAGTVEAWVTVKIGTADELGIAVEPTIFPPLELSLFGLAGSDPPKLVAFEDKSLITVIGFKFNGVIDQLKHRLPNLKVMAAHGHLTAFRMLRAGRARYLIDYYLPGIDAAKSLDMKGMAHSTIYKQPTYLYIAREVPDAAALVSRLSRASARILERTGKAK